jgi:phage shock protein A
MYSESDAKKALDRIAAVEKRVTDLEQRLAKLEGTKKPYAKGVSIQPDPTTQR